MRDLANLSWAFARLQCFDAGLLDAVAAAAVANHPEEAGQELSSILWSFASFVVVQRPLVTTFSETLLQRIDEFSPQSLMMTAWSLSTLGMSGWSQMRVIADAARPRLAEFNELWIGSILWSIASCPVEEEEELERKRYLVSLSSAPVLHPLGQWRGHKLCLLANGLFQVKDELPEIWQQVETRWMTTCGPQAFAFSRCGTRTRRGQVSGEDPIHRVVSRGTFLHPAFAGFAPDQRGRAGVCGISTVASPAARGGERCCVFRTF